MDLARNSATFPQLEQSSKNVDKCLQRDNCAPTLVDLLNLHNGASVSGLTEYDYPTLAGIPAHMCALTQMKTVNKVPMPPEILEHFNHMQCHCTMGLLPAINRAYLTIDTDIYLWRYDSGADVAYYDGLGDTVVSVGLVVPRAGVFQPFIKHLLVLTTAVDIVVLGVAFTRPNDAADVDEIQLVPEPVFSLPTDGATVMQIMGTQDGRLFYGTKDGCLFEIVYQATPSWFGKRCKKINHSSSALSFLVPSFINAALTEEDSIAQIAVDNSAHVLYVLTERSTVAVYDMGAQGSGLSRVAVMTVGAISQRAMAIVKTLDSQIFKPIVSIAPVGLSESNFVHLVAVTQAGVRLYFSTYRQPRTPLQLAARPYTLDLVHVRLPPGFSGNLAVGRPRAVHSALYRDRCLVLVTRTHSASAAAVGAAPGQSTATTTTPTAAALGGPAEADAVWCVSADLFPFHAHLAEAYTMLPVDGPVLAMAEVNIPDDGQPQPTAQSPPALVRQHAQPARKYVALTATGAHILVKLRPVDLLRQLLVDSRGMDSDAIRAYFHLQGDDEACATCLILARDDNGSTANGEDVLDHATRSFFLFGGEPKVPATMPMAPHPGGMGGGQMGAYGTPQQQQQQQQQMMLQQQQQQSRDGIMNQTNLYPGQSMFMPNIISTPLSTHQQQQQQQQQQANLSLAPQQLFHPSMSLNPNQSLPNPSMSLNPNLSMTANMSLYPNLNVSQPYSPSIAQQQQQQQQQLQGGQSPFGGGAYTYAQQQMSLITGVMDTMSVRYSAKHNGLFYYLARILRPMWNLCCVDRTTVDGKKFYMISSLTADECASITAHLDALRMFLQRNTQLSICLGNSHTGTAQSTGPAGTESSNRNVGATMANTTATFPYPNAMHAQRSGALDAQTEERQSLDALKAMVNHCCQVVGLWKILCEHQFHLLLETLPDTSQQKLQNSAFKDLLLYGSDMCQSLINVLINSYLGDNASVDSISAKLRDVCPNYYKTEDAAYSKANELLKHAEGVQNVDEKEDAISEAMQLCKTVSPHINLPEVCQKLTALGAYNAIVELCSAFVKKTDPENIAEHFYKSGDETNRDGYQFYLKRMEIYKEISSMLTVIHQKDVTLITNVSGQASTSQQTSSTSPLVRGVINTLLTTSTDQLLHVAVYEWMMQRGMQTDLIRITEPSLETYLLKAAAAGPSQTAAPGTSADTSGTLSSAHNVPILDLLWKYYETNRNHSGAAKVLGRLASTTGSSLTLAQRTEYLARAIMCMRSDQVGYAPYLGVFLRELEDRLEIAKVQVLILDAIQNTRRTHPNADDAIALLNSGLFEVTQLYEDFADRFELWECKLAIINCAGYSDPGLVASIWRHIVKEESQKTTGPPNDRMLNILSKVKILAKFYIMSTTCFPLDGIIRELEHASACLKANSSLVPNFLISIEIPIETLLNTYNQVMGSSMGDRFWSLDDNQFHYSECVSTLICGFLYTHEKYSNTEKRKLVALCQDSIAGILSNLYSKAGTDNLVNILRTAQEKLQRL